MFLGGVLFWACLGWGCCVYIVSLVGVVVLVGRVEGIDGW